ncbi:hypothetical protein IFM89_029788 [Coptis chinensis]|uniref:glutathione transferase n=1 Tax=Coptis chinensis TaxID=261450 RepID=A0A835IF30_9MAGN|nr:hypothetical protein IFM89_029788 [Coptis chinensis]
MVDRAKVEFYGSNTGAQQTTTRIGQLPTQVVVQTITENVTAVPNSHLAESVPIVCVGPSTVRTEESSQSSGAQENGTVVEELNTSRHDTGADPSIGLQLALYVPAEIATPIEDLKLIGIWSSPFYHRIVLALKMKEIEYEYIEEDLTNKSPLLLQYNPIHKKVPVLVHNGKPICESLVILQYIEDTWKQNPILPSDPHEKAMALFWAKFGDDKLLSSVFGFFMKQGKEKEEARNVVGENLKFLEEELKEKNFFGGEEIGFVDLCLVWIVCYLSVLDELNGIKMCDEETFPLLSAWMDRFSSSPIIKEIMPPREKLVRKLQKMQAALLPK